MSFEQESVRLTADNLKALAHPLRVQILGLLRTYGPATATGLAARLGLTSGALSYHLRQLERFGFIAEDVSQGDRRDRWWRAVHRSTAFSSADLDPAAAEAGEAYEEGVISAITRSLTAAQAERRSWPIAWQRAYDMSDVLLELTAEEAEQLAKDLLGVLRRYRQHTPGVAGPPAARVVSARYQIHPVAGSLEKGEPGGESDR